MLNLFEIAGLRIAGNRQQAFRPPGWHFSCLQKRAVRHRKMLRVFPGLGCPPWRVQFSTVGVGFGAETAGNTRCKWSTTRAGTGNRTDSYYWWWTPKCGWRRSWRSHSRQAELPPSRQPNPLNPPGIIPGASPLPPRGYSSSRSPHPQKRSKRFNEPAGKHWLLSRYVPASGISVSEQPSVCGNSPPDWSSFSAQKPEIVLGPRRWEWGRNIGILWCLDVRWTRWHSVNCCVPCSGGRHNRAAVQGDRRMTWLRREDGPGCNASRMESQRICSGHWSSSKIVSFPERLPPLQPPRRRVSPGGRTS